MHERLWPDMDIPNTIVQNKRASIWLLDETSMTGDELWGDQTSRPLSVCMSYLLMTAFKALIVRLCSTVGRMELSLLGLGCGYTKTFLVETDGKISGGAESVMSIDLGNHLEHYWNARRYSVAFPYLTSTFDDLTIWELVLFMLDRLVLGDFPDFEPAMVQFGFRLFPFCHTTWNQTYRRCVIPMASQRPCDECGWNFIEARSLRKELLLHPNSKLVWPFGIVFAGLTNLCLICYTLHQTVLLCF